MIKRERTESNSGTIEYLELSAGMGKTYSTLKWMVETSIPSGDRWVYVVPSKVLASEIENTLEVFGYSGYHTITDVLYSKFGVMNATLDILSGGSLYDVDVDEVGCFIITHANWNNIIDKGLVDNFSGYSVVVDELPEILEMDSIRISRDSDLLSTRLVEDEDCKGVYRLTKSRGLLSSLQQDGLYNGSRHQQIFYESLLSSGVVFREVKDNHTHYETYRMRDYKQVVSCVDRLIFLGARIKDTLSERLLVSMGLEFKTFTDVVPSRTEYLNQERVTIYYLTDEKLVNGCSSSLLKSYYNPKTDKKLKLQYKGQGVPDGYVSIYQTYVERAYSVLGEDFIYTVNYEDPYKKIYKEVSVDGKAIGEVIPYNCHGLNSYSSFSKALSLFCFKPSPLNRRTLTYIGGYYGVPDVVELYVNHKMREASYQLCTRSALRDFSDVDRDISFVVPDISVANYIKDYHIPDCKVDNSIALYIPDMREGNGGHNKSSFTEDNKLTKKEGLYINNIKSKHTKKYGQPPEDSLLLDKLIKYRNKKGER